MKGHEARVETLDYHHQRVNLFRLGEVGGFVALWQDK